jgi:hypothetical protein
MGAQNECLPGQDGKRAAIDLATARPEDFSSKCWNIDNRLSHASSEYAKQFMTAMNGELENRNLLPKVELNFVAQTNAPALEILADKHQHTDTPDLVKAEDDLKSQGRTVESSLVHGLITHADDIKDTHAERNFWGKNHGGIDMDRLQRWNDKTRPDMYGTNDDNNSSPAARPHFTPGIYDDRKDLPPTLRPHQDHNGDNNSPKNDANATSYDKKQDSEIRRLSDELARERKANQDLEKATHLKEKVENGVIKDAHHTVQHGETLYDMACLALHKAGRNHMTPAAIKFEEEKIRALNHLAPHEALTSGQSLMLRTPAEVERETARRVKLEEKSAKPEENSELEPGRRETVWSNNPRMRGLPPDWNSSSTTSSESHSQWHLPPSGLINSYRKY